MVMCFNFLFVCLDVHIRIEIEKERNRHKHKSIRKDKIKMCDFFVVFHFHY